MNLEELKKDSKKYKEFRRKANERNRKYYSKPEIKARKKIYKKEYDIKNKERNKKYGEELRARPEYQERIRKWREKNKEHLKKRGKEWREKNKEKKNKTDREYSKKLWRDPELRKKELERQKRFRTNFPEKVRVTKRKYNQSAKGWLESTRANHKRMTLKKKCQFELTIKQIKQVQKRDKVCVYCGSDKRLELDHIIPLSKGGEGISDNFVLACRSCNSSKNAQDVFKWCKAQKIKVPEIVIGNLDKMKRESNLKIPTT
jgi:5-methylcytosine-specific restriction endonuclease McrA